MVISLLHYRLEIDTIQLPCSLLAVQLVPSGDDSLVHATSHVTSSIQAAEVLAFHLYLFEVEFTYNTQVLRCRHYAF